MVKNDQDWLRLVKNGQEWPRMTKKGWKRLRLAKNDLEYLVKQHICTVRVSVDGSAQLSAIIMHNPWLSNDNRLCDGS